MCADQDRGPRRLMQKGLALILVGHINFILGAIVHGNVLRHVSQPDGQVTTEYTATNVISVCSGLLSIACGIVAIVASRNLRVSQLQVGLVAASLLNALLSAACCAGLLLAIGVTVAHGGRGLMRGCDASDAPVDARSPVGVQCPFDATRIYDTTLALWIPSSVLAATEAGLSVWCLVAGLTLRGLVTCGNSYVKEQLEDEAQRSPHSRRLMGRRSPPDA
ncbi:keratinocyte-associated protein 3 [Neosynchiropus ocellatus]